VSSGPARAVIYRVGLEGRRLPAQPWLRTMACCVLRGGQTARCDPVCNPPRRKHLGHFSSGPPTRLAEDGGTGVGATRELTTRSLRTRRGRCRSQASTPRSTGQPRGPGSTERGVPESRGRDDEPGALRRLRSTICPCCRQ